MHSSCVVSKSSLTLPAPLQWPSSQCHTAGASGGSGGGGTAGGAGGGGEGAGGGGDGGGEACGGQGSGSHVSSTSRNAVLCLEYGR